MKYIVYCTTCTKNGKIYIGVHKTENPEVFDGYIGNGLKIGYMYRENPVDEVDSGWRFFAGDETEEYTSNANNFEIYDLNTICNYDETILPYLNSEIGSSYEKIDDHFEKIS